MVGVSPTVYELTHGRYPNFIKLCFIFLLRWTFVFHGIIVATLGSTAYHWGTFIEAEITFYVFGATPPGRRYHPFGVLLTNLYNNYINNIPSGLKPERLALI